MKKLLTLSYFLFLISYSLFSQSVGIGTAAPNASAQLDVSATNKGMLVPRVTNVQMLAIASPANGLLVYNTDSACFAYRNATAWVFIKGNATAGNDWSTNGNAGTDASKNFIGTTDNVDLVFKRNNQRAGLIGINNTGYGTQALNPSTTGNSNTANGAGALAGNGSGSFNTSSGAATLLVNDTGSFNTANGYQALRFNKGSSNTAIGMNALLFNNAGNSNTAAGVGALSSNTTGFSNVAIGINALNKNTDRSNLVAIGDSALFNNGTGATQPEEATANTGIGSKALYSNTTGFSNVAIGINALNKNTGGSNLVAIGANALYNNGPAGAFFFQANDNTAVGNEALYTNSTGAFNTAIGRRSLYLNTTGSENTANGISALFSNTSGSSNTANGIAALFSNTSGSSNTANGTNALRFNTSGSYNTAMGELAGYLSTGSSNVFLGYKAGRNESGSNKLYISNDETNAANTLIYGEFDNKILSVGGKLGIGTTVPENLLHIKNANTDANASQLIIEGNSNFGASTYAAIEFRNNFSAFAGGPAGRIKVSPSPSYTGNAISIQTTAAGPSFVDAMVLSNGNVSVPNGNLFAGGLVGIGTAPSDFPLSIKANTFYGQLIKFYNNDGALKWNLSMFTTALSDINKTDLNFTESGVADYRLYLKAGGEVGIGKIPLTSINDSRLQIKQKGQQNGIGVEAPNSNNHWDFYTTTDAASNFNLYYNGSLKGAFDNVTGAYTANSDRRLKKDITQQQPVLNNIMQLQAYQYHYLDNKSTDNFSNGFMAQDVQKLFPDAVVENTMKDGETRLGINYQYFTVLAIKGLQEQQQIINKQEERIAKLETMIKALAGK